MLYLSLISIISANRPKSTQKAVVHFRFQSVKNLIFYYFGWRCVVMFLLRLCFYTCLSVHGGVSAPLHAGIHPPGQTTPPPSACWDAVNKRAVRIPLECNLVWILMSSHGFWQDVCLALVCNKCRHIARINNNLSSLFTQFADIYT